MSTTTDERTMRARIERVVRGLRLRAEDCNNEILRAERLADAEALETIITKHFAPAEDTAMLDWLERHPGSVYASVDPERGLEHFVAVPEKDQNARRGFVEKSVRSAIRAAMKQEEAR